MSGVLAGTKPRCTSSPVNPSSFPSPTASMSCNGSVGVLLSCVQRQTGRRPHRRRRGPTSTAQGRGAPLFLTFFFLPFPASLVPARSREVLPGGVVFRPRQLAGDGEGGATGPWPRPSPSFFSSFPSSTYLDPVRSREPARMAAREGDSGAAAGPLTGARALLRLSTPPSSGLGDGAL